MRIAVRYMAQSRDYGSSLEALLGAADGALYEVKKRGRGACALAS